MERRTDQAVEQTDIQLNAPDHTMRGKKKIIIKFKFYNNITTFTHNLNGPGYACAYMVNTKTMKC